jgi:hypothetical protein
MHQLASDDASDEKSGDDEEHVDPDVASGNNVRKGMESEHGQHCHAAQAIDCRAILEVFGVLL